MADDLLLLSDVLNYDESDSKDDVEFDKNVTPTDVVGEQKGICFQISLQGRATIRVSLSQCQRIACHSQISISCRCCTC